MTSIYVDRLETYGKLTSAEALFFHSSLRDDIKGLRVLLPNEGLEFTDGSYIGTDPTGFLYFYNLDEAKTANRYVSDTIINPRDQQLCAWIKFYDSSDQLVAEFLGDDYFNTVEVAGMIKYGKRGIWQSSSAKSFVEAYLKKNGDSTTVTLDISNAIKKVATMTINDSGLKMTSLPDIEGRFHYSNLDEVNKGTYVSYSNDRLVFYEDDVTGHTFTGYFIPNGRGDSDHLLGVQGETELTLKGTVWT